MATNETIHVTFLRRPLLAALALALCSPAAARPPEVIRDIEVTAASLPLDADDPGQTVVGRLTYLGGLRLSAKPSRWGGFSSLEISPDGTRLFTATDRGNWWSAALTLENGVPVGIGENILVDMPDDTGQAIEGADNDSEGMAVTPAGDIYVSFERNHRIVRFTPPDPADPASLAQARPTLLDAPPELAAAPNNAGLEAIALMKDGTLFALTEAYLGAPGYNRGWLIRDGRWEPFEYKRTEPFDVTDAKQLPNGDMLVLERRFSMLGGLGARLCTIDGASIRPGARLECRTVAEMQPPHSIDNMEGLAVRTGDEGETIVYIISDDNLSALQRTVLLVFRLEPGRK